MNIFQIINGKDPAFKKNMWFFLTAYFFVILNYALIRAASTTLFFEASGAKSSPVAWLWAVVFLSLAIFLCNLLQKKISVQKVFLGASLLSGLIFFGTLWGFQSGIKQLAWTAFIWKEIYIVIQAHLLLGYANNYLGKTDFKLMIGPLGAVGSVGGVLGGIFTSYASSIHGTFFVMAVGIFFVCLPAMLFLFTVPAKTLLETPSKKLSPLASLDTRELKDYVFCIAMMVALSQFIINIADFKFNMVFEQSVADSSARTTYLGHVYTITNGLTFVLQFIFLPYILPRVKEKSMHLFIPISYLMAMLAMILGQGIGLLPLSILFIYLKASDYSLFTAGKELLYQPLKEEQKYGAKYLTDMLMYRFSKALIAVVLIYLQSSTMLNMLAITFLSLWVIIVVKLFQLRRKLFIEVSHEQSLA